MLKSRLIKCIEKLLTGLVLIIWLTVVILVTLRYAFNGSIPGANEWIVILFVYATSLGAALGVGQGGHLAIEVVVEKASCKVRQRIQLVRTGLMGLLHLSIIALSIHWISVTGHFLMPSTGLPRWVAQISIPMGGFIGLVFIFFQLHQLLSKSSPSSAITANGVTHPKEKSRP